jgi:hypothetical protein
MKKFTKIYNKMNGIVMDDDKENKEENDVFDPLDTQAMMEELDELEKLTDINTDL